MRWYCPLWAHKRGGEKTQPTYQIWACIERIYHVEPYSTISWGTTAHTTPYLRYRIDYGSGRLCRGVVYHRELVTITLPLWPYISHCNKWDIFVSEAWSWRMAGVEHMFWWTIFRQGRCTIIISHICDDVKSFSHQFSLAHMFYLTERTEWPSGYCTTLKLSLCAVWKWTFKMPYPIGWHYHIVIIIIVIIYDLPYIRAYVYMF